MSELLSHVVGWVGTSVAKVENYFIVEAKMRHSGDQIPGRENGGNCDIKNLSRGCKVYFPVFVEGANLSVGDMHFSQVLHSHRNTLKLRLSRIYILKDHFRFGTIYLCRCSQVQSPERHSANQLLLLGNVCYGPIHTAMPGLEWNIL